MDQPNIHIADVPRNQVIVGLVVVCSVVGSWVVRLPEASVIPVSVFLVAVVAVPATVATGRRLSWFRTEAGFGFYFIVLALLLPLLALGAYGPAYSSSRAMVVAEAGA